jgi:hypothetical protein
MTGIPEAVFVACGKAMPSDSTRAKQTGTLIAELGCNSGPGSMEVVRSSFCQVLNRAGKSISVIAGQIDQVTLAHIPKLSEVPERRRLNLSAFRLPAVVTG